MPLTTPAVRRHAWTFVKWVVQGGLLLLLVGAVVQCKIEQQNVRTANNQTFNMSRIAAFRDSGAELDKRVAAFNDAASEGRDLSESRQNVRSALADHASKTMAMSDTFDRTSLAVYNADLKTLQKAIESTTNAKTPGPIITALSRVVVARNKLADDASKKATT